MLPSNRSPADNDCHAPKEYRDVRGTKSGDKGLPRFYFLQRIPPRLQSSILPFCQASIPILIPAWEEGWGAYMEKLHLLDFNLKLH